MRPLGRLLGPSLLFCALGTGVAAADQGPEPITFERDEGARAEVAEQLGSGRYRFCNDEGYRLWQDDKDRLCGRLGEIGADCAGLAAACGRPAWDETAEDPPTSNWLLSLASFFGSFGGQVFRFLFWVALGIGMLFLLRALIRVIKVAGPRDTAIASPTRSTIGPEIDAASQPAHVLLEQAAAYLEAGDPRRALHFSYAALLAGLDHAGLVRVHRASTSGDYRRWLRRSQPDGSAGPLLWDIDLTRFQAAVDLEAARALTARVRATLGRLTGLSTICLLVGAHLLGGCAALGDREAAGAPTGPRGFALLEGLVQSRTASFSRRLRRVSEVPENTAVVLAINPNLRALEWATLETYVEEGGHMIVAGPADGLDAAFGIERAPSKCTAPLAVKGLAVITPDTMTSSLTGLARPAPSATSETPAMILATCGSLDFAHTYWHGDGQLTVVGDASFFDNTSLALGDNASFTVALFGGRTGHLEFIGPWTGSGAVHPLESIARSSVGPWLLHLLGALALLAWARGRRFGSPRPPSPEARRSLVEHARALAGHYQKQRDAGAALARYATWAVTLLGKRSGSSNRDLRALSESLASKHAKGQPAEIEIKGARDIHQILLRARAGAELGGDKAKVMRAYRVLTTMVDDTLGTRGEPNRK